VRATTAVLMGSSVIYGGMVMASGPPGENPGAVSGACEVTSAEGVGGVARVAFSMRSARVFFADGRSRPLLVSQVIDEHRVKLSARQGDPPFEANLVRSAGTSPGTFSFHGTWGGAPASLQVKSLDLSNTPLPTRGFRWVSGFPNNQ